ncbi:TAXI family TRAP transporter solute-binding subunit [Thermodesulfobacteriota bacterium]
MKKQFPVSQDTCRWHRLDRNWLLRALLIFLLLLPLTIPTPCVGETKPLFRIGTGGLTGVYFPVGKLIATGLTEPAEGKDALETGVQGVPGYIGVAQNSAGSIENVQMVTSGEIEAGIIQADVAAWAFRSEHAFAGDKSVRVVRAVASLYPEKFQIVTRRDANIRNVMDLRGKRISIDEIGSGTLAAMRIVLEAHGLSEKDLLPVYLKPVFTHDKMVKGDLQGFVMMAGAPMEAVTQLLKIRISLVPIAPEMASLIGKRFPYLVPAKIPAGVYPGIPDTPTLQVHALLVVNSSMHDDLVYQVTAALWSKRTLALLKSGHPQGKSITPQTALTGISIPLHPGAERFYREHDMMPEETHSP